MRYCTDPDDRHTLQARDAYAAELLNLTDRVETALRESSASLVDRITLLIRTSNERIEAINHFFRRVLAVHSTPLSEDRVLRAQVRMAVQSAEPLKGASCWETIEQIVTEIQENLRPGA
jgi:hypothetical protein